MSKKASMHSDTKKTHSGSHTANIKFGMGDHYGTGVKAPVGKIRGSTVGFKSLSKKGLKTPPKSLA